MSDWVFLSGPMGSGKSALAGRVAALRGTQAIDLDERIERAAGKSIAEIFGDRGEAGFRALERDALHAVLSEARAGVLALGGGTVAELATRRQLLAAGTLVTLRASIDTLVQRVGDARTRPLLAGQDVRARLEALLAARAEAYAECHGELFTDGKALVELAREVDDLVSDERIVVPLGARTYRVEVGAGTRHALGARAQAAAQGKQVVLVTDEGVLEPWAKQARAALEQASHAVTEVCLQAGEAHKNITSIERIWDAALDAGVDRDALVIAVGGGVVGDMAAFAASTLLRGVAFGQLPTTLLAMVDSAVGGKTGIDRRQGKNLVGSFHQPRFVLCDVETLATLPLAERRAGLAEVVKSAWLDGEASVAMLEARAEALLRGDLDATIDAVRMSVQLKARIVTEDERESGMRATLNLGHTLGHAIEVASGYTALRHGEAVALGMVAAFRLAARLSGQDEGHGVRVEALLKRLGLPIDVDRYLDERTLSFIDADKKKKGGKVRFVVPHAPGDTRLVSLASTEIAQLVLR